MLESIGQSSVLQSEVSDPRAISRRDDPRSIERDVTDGYISHERINYTDKRKAARDDPSARICMTLRTDRAGDHARRTNAKSNGNVSLTAAGRKKLCGLIMHACEHRVLSVVDS
jgi:hypothetical protein